jgi:hypothetical protein
MYKRPFSLCGSLFIPKLTYGLPSIPRPVDALYHYHFQYFHTAYGIQHCRNLYRFQTCTVVQDSSPPPSRGERSPCPSLSSQSSASRSSLRMPQLITKPNNAMPPNKPKGRASPFGCILVAAENSDPERKGPAARPAAESVCARPFKRPKTL